MFITILFYAFLLYVGVGSQIAGLYVFMTDFPKILNNEIKVETILEMFKYLGKGIARITYYTLICPKTFMYIVNWFKNIRKNI